MIQIKHGPRDAIYHAKIDRGNERHLLSMKQEKKITNVFLINYRFFLFSRDRTPKSFIYSLELYRRFFDPLFLFFVLWRSSLIVYLSP